VPYRISFEGSGEEYVRSKTAKDALIMAQGLEEHGKQRVQVSCPDGTELSLRQFAVLVNSAGIKNA
jgi:hypothetical protein